MKFTLNISSAEDIETQIVSNILFWGFMTAVIVFAISKM